MLITQIKRKGKSETYHVYVDDQYFALLEAEIIYKYKVKVETNFTEEQLKEIKLESDKLLCSIKAMDYVAKMLRTTKQVRQYLKKHNFEKEAIDIAINKLKDYGYLNDEYYAKLSAESLSTTKGKRYIKHELMEKGIAEDKIELILEDMDGENEACENVTKKWLKGKVFPLDEKNKQKLYRFLIARGFEYGTIKSVLNNVTEGEQDDWY